jgi:hypothetical protein
MLRRKKLLGLGIGLAGLLLSTICAAGQWYGELSYLRSDGSLPNDSDQAFIGFDTDNRDSGWKLMGGYELNRYFSIEAGYADFGTQSLQSNFVGPVLAGNPSISPSPGTFFDPFRFATQPTLGFAMPAFMFAGPMPLPPGAEVETSLEAVPLSAIGQLPVNGWLALTLQAGAMLSRYEITTETRILRIVDGELVPETLRESDTSREAELFAGLGFLFSVGERIAIELAWEKILDAGAGDALEQDIDTYNLGLRYRF